MTRFLRRRLLTNGLLESFPDRRYEGQIASVVTEEVLNRWTLRKTEAPVIAFTDGNAWIPNDGARRMLIDVWGAETNNWIGHWLAIFLVTSTRTDKASGRLVERLEKRVEPLRRCPR
jgi:hypothetical protein